MVTVLIVSPALAPHMASGSSECTGRTEQILYQYQVWTTRNLEYGDYVQNLLCWINLSSSSIKDMSISYSFNKIFLFPEPFQMKVAAYPVVLILTNALPGGWLD